MLHNSLENVDLYSQCVMHIKVSFICKTLLRVASFSPLPSVRRIHQVSIVYHYARHLQVGLLSFRMFTYKTYTVFGTDLLLSYWHVYLKIMNSLSSSSSEFLVCFLLLCFLTNFYSANFIFHTLICNLLAF